MHSASVSSEAKVKCFLGLTTLDRSHKLGWLNLLDNRGFTLFLYIVRICRWPFLYNCDMFQIRMIRVVQIQKLAKQVCFLVEAAWPSGQRNCGLAIRQSRVRVPLWSLAGFVVASPEFKSSAMLVNTYCQLRYLILLCSIWIIWSELFEWSDRKLAEKATSTSHYKQTLNLLVIFYLQCWFWLQMLWTD